MTVKDESVSGGVEYSGKSAEHDSDDAPCW